MINGSIFDIGSKFHKMIKYINLKFMTIRKLIANRAPIFEYDREYLAKYSDLEDDKLEINQDKTTGDTEFQTDYFTSIDSIYYDGVFEAIKKNRINGYVVSNVTPKINGIYYYHD